MSGDKFCELHLEKYWEKDGCDQCENNIMKVFCLNDCDWWVGGSLVSCIADYINHVGEDDPDYYLDAFELNDNDLENTMISVFDGDEIPAGSRTFKEELDIQIKRGGTFPRIFASTEF
jgi:hypothetical protein